MKTIRDLLLLMLVVLPGFVSAEVKDISFTLDDRDRIIRTEQKLDALEGKVESKVDDLRSEMNARFDQLFNFLWAIIGIFTTITISIFGFAFWDRKLSTAPLKRENEKILQVLRDYSEHQVRLREILKNAGLL